MTKRMPRLTRIFSGREALYWFFMSWLNGGPDVRKSVFWVSDHVVPKPATETTSYNCEILLIASFDMILSNKRITKALIRLRGSAGWSSPLLFANPEDRVSLIEDHYNTTVLCSIG